MKTFFFIITKCDFTYQSTVLFYNFVIREIGFEQITNINIDRGDQGDHVGLYSIMFHLEINKYVKQT